MSEARPHQVFGKRREPHTVIIAKGDDIRHFTIRPWLVTLAGAAVSAVAIGYLLATSYLVVRDDLIGATVARQARMQQAYEDRIASLRAQVDRITSRQMLDQQLMENKVSELLSRQSQLTQRHGRLGPILERAGHAESGLPAEVPLPETKPDLRVDLPIPASKLAALSDLPALRPGAVWQTSKQASESAADRADRLFVEITQSLKSIEQEQLESIRSLTAETYQTAETISKALDRAGLSIDLDDEVGQGGPLMPVGMASSFELEVEELDSALSRLESLKYEASRLPIASPAPGRAVSSLFGIRKDPIIGRPAFHSGMDFRAEKGSPVKATAPGTVVSAGWNGGYGRMVEVRHEDGLTTRYAHMSRILVSVGDTVETGTVVGRVGSTGRSTGPHLHYEIRREGRPIDPLRIIKAGKTVAKYM